MHFSACFGVLLRLFAALILSGHIARGKECTNQIPQLASHTSHYDLFRTDNLSWREEAYKTYHLTPTDDSAWATLRPRKFLKGGSRDEFDWATMYRQMKTPGMSTGGATSSLKEVSLHDVRLHPADSNIHWRAQQTNLEYLLMLDVDSLVWSFRKTANLSTLGTPYGGWEAHDGELRGHFVGHYLSATALMWASTQNHTLYEKMNKVVSALNECQQKIERGYLSAFPTELFDRLEKVVPVWAPYYTIHKIMAGLLDQYLHVGNNQTLDMVVKMADYFGGRVENIIRKYTIERQWEIQLDESGGMNDVLYRLYSVTGNPKHLVLAHLFDKPCFLGLLAVEVDSISGFHSNTHIPIVVGAQFRYEVTGDELYKKISTYFMDFVNSSHLYATGGTSVGEFWSNPKRLATDLQKENEESCTTYNMLKVSRNLFRWTKQMAYADYYERALTNGVLSIQRGTEPGKMIYMLPLGHGVSKAVTYHGWGTPFQSFWCCYGTAIESFSKLGDSIYFEEGASVPSLYIIQYISSSFNWRSGQLTLNQEVVPVASTDAYLQVSWTFSTNKEMNEPSILHLRMPSWSNSNGAKAQLNGEALFLPLPGNFLEIQRTWSSNDKLNIQLPISLRLEAVQDDRPEYASVQAILFGPYLLAGLSEGDWDVKTGAATSPSDWIKPVPASYNTQLVSLTQQVHNVTLAFTRNSNNTMEMTRLPQPGTDPAVHSTFRFIPKDTSVNIRSTKAFVGKSVIIEPFDLPGMMVAPKGRNNDLRVTGPRKGPESDGDHTFLVVPGLNQNPKAISLASHSFDGCFLHSQNNLVQLGCSSNSTNGGAEFSEAASFILRPGFSKYHPISFVANGANRNYLLVPLLSLRDESYNVYFKLVSSIQKE